MSCEWIVGCSLGLRVSSANGNLCKDWSKRPALRQSRGWVLHSSTGDVSEYLLGQLTMSTATLDSDEELYHAVGL
jgi:hypothetical protein